MRSVPELSSLSGAACTCTIQLCRNRVSDKETVHRVDTERHVCLEYKYQLHVPIRTNIELQLC